MVSLCPITSQGSLGGEPAVLFTQLGKMCQQLKPSSSGSLNEEHGGPRPANVTSCCRGSVGINNPIESINFNCFKQEIGCSSDDIQIGKDTTSFFKDHFT